MMARPTAKAPTSLWTNPATKTPSRPFKTEPKLVPEVVRLLREAGVDAPVVVGGIIPEDDRAKLADQGIAAVYTPKDFQLGRIMDDIARLAEEHRRVAR